MRSAIPLSLWILLIFFHLAGCQLMTAKHEDIVACANGENPTPIPQDFHFKGTLLIYDPTQSHIIGYDGETQEFITLLDLTDEEYYISSVSPDGRWLLISRSKPSDPHLMELYAVFHNGQITHKEFNLPESDDQALRYYNWISSQSFWGRVKIHERAVYGVFEPLIPSWREIDFKSLDFQNDTGIALSPDLSRVLYVNSEWDLVLYDIQDNKTLWKNTEYEAVTPVYSSPVLYPAIWSTEGNLLAVPTSSSSKHELNFGILVLDQTGHLISSAFLDNRPDGLSFSHNQKYLAFFEERKTAEYLPVIRLMDITSEEITDLCMLGPGTDPVMRLLTKRIYWSPDDAYVAYNYGDVPPAVKSENKNGLIVQKLDQGQIWLLPSEGSNFTLLGWSPYRWTPSQVK